MHMTLIILLLNSIERLISNDYTLESPAHHKPHILYKVDKDFALSLQFSGQILSKVISIKRTLLYYKGSTMLWSQ